ncbi:MAG TPA: DUF2934 domain-containing protein [Mariprofundaceae bacterium]|nr:DUF2934 domain-containing protein [Mariprofundaceae bacterium]
MDAKRKANRKSAGATAKKEKGASLWVEIRRQMIAEAAYYHAEQRGFATGNEMQDWLEAEKEIDRRLDSGRS